MKEIDEILKSEKIYEQHLLANQQTELAKEKDNYLREFTQLQNQEKDLLSKLKDRYGDGQTIQYGL